MAFPRSSQWLGPESARQHRAKQPGFGASTNQTPNLDSQPRPEAAEGSHETLSGIPGWERPCDSRLELRAGLQVLVSMLCEETGNSSSILEPPELIGPPHCEFKNLSFLGQEPVSSVPGVPRLTRQRRPSSASSASPCGTTPSHPESFSRWVVCEGPVHSEHSGGCPRLSQACTEAPQLTYLSPSPARCAPRQLLGLPGASGLCCGPPLCPHPPHSCHLRACAQGLVPQQHHLQCSQGLRHLCEYLLRVGIKGGGRLG